MSLALAFQMIGRYTVAYSNKTSEVQQLQNEIARIGTQPGGPNADNNRQALENTQKELAIATFLQGLSKDFLEYWKQVVKDMEGMIKSLSELASGSR